MTAGKRGPSSRTRRQLVLGAAAAAALGTSAARAQSKGGTIRLVVGFVPGGAADRVARVLAPELAQSTGRGAIVENVPGANSARAIARVAASEPTGDVLLFATSAIAHPDNAAAVEALRPVIAISTSPMVLVVRSSLPVHGPEEFARYAKAHPGITYGSAGVGNATHLCAEELMARIGVEALHVPYQGSGAALNDLLGGRIDFLTAGASAALTHHDRIRALAVTTGRRSTLTDLDRLPTISETFAPGFDFGLWQAVWAPAGLPSRDVDALNGQLRALIDTAPVRRALADVGAEVLGGSPQDALRLCTAEVERHRKRSSTWVGATRFA